MSWLIDFGSWHVDRLETYVRFICQPGLVLTKGNQLPSMLMSLSRSIQVNEFGCAVVKIANGKVTNQTKGHKQSPVLGR
jgi:hypothetical protein